MARRAAPGWRVARLVDMGGGLVTAVSPDLFNDNEAQFAQCVDLSQKGTIRPALGRWDRYDSPFSQYPVRGVYAYYKKDGTSHLLMYSGGALYCDLPHFVRTFDSQPEWDQGSKHNVDTAASPGDVKIAVPGNPTFSRSSVAYTSTGEEVASGQPRYETGQFGQAIMIEEETTNLLRNSEAFGSWTLLGTPVITSDSAAAPNGTITADTVGDDDAAGHEGVRQEVTISADTALYTVSIFVKKDTVTTRFPSLNFGFLDSGGASVSWVGVRIDTTNGQTYVWAGTPTNVSVQEINGYYRLSYSLQNPGTGVKARVDFWPAHSTTHTGAGDR
ncbi:MAG: hypothetical protein H5U04_12025, partial [Firmicutes bacterium]|nr:hypothetical protein [Bacillota bacterium]